MSLPGIELGTGIVVGAPKALDSKYGPFTGNTLAAAKTAALSAVTSGFRFEGLTVGLIVSGQDIVEYQFRGGIADSNFVEKTSSGSVIVEKGGTQVVTTNTFNYGGLFKITDNNGVADVISSNFTFTVGAPSATATWNINHNLDKYPSVVAVNTSNEEMFGALTYVDKNNVTITFKSAVAGFAYLN